MPGDPNPPAAPVENITPPGDSKATAEELLLYAQLSSAFDTQIKAQKINILISGVFAAAVWVAGLVGTLLLYRSKGLAGTALEYMKLGPATLSSLALPFPLRSYLQYRVRMPVYRFYKLIFDEATATRRRVPAEIIANAFEALKELQKIG